MDARTIQRALAARGYYSGAIDGIIGPKSHEGISQWLREVLDHDAWTRWSGSRRLVAVKQLMLASLDIETGAIDGLMGPQTAYAMEVWQDRMRDVTPDDHEVAHQPTVWPRQRDVGAYFGTIGIHQTMLECPYPLRLAWDLDREVNRFSIHAKVHDSAKRVLQGVLEHYGMETIRDLRLDLFGGCLNVRKMRGGSSWSMHSWGIALDFDPERNQLRWGADRAAFARPEYDKWWELWEAEGWISLGRERDMDFMHVQAARL